ncbi:hypothetical protein OUZ56_006652 [Daphnia magna]|uniref:Uncharacterized protein n=1 Tax=Daphnia magna TaxID=35525 RepID=A0ABQ9YWA3_9CRUS|nr:hypothetical protein OUZ56_006652 [Daphnia magna]
MDNTQVVLFIRRQVLPTKANEKEVGRFGESGAKQNKKFVVHVLSIVRIDPAVVKSGKEEGSSNKIRKKEMKEATYLLMRCIQRNLIIDVITDNIPFFCSQLFVYKIEIKLKKHMTRCLARHSHASPCRDEVKVICVVIECV